MPRPRRVMATAAALVCSALLAACGSSSDNSSKAGSSPEPPRPIVPVAGCEKAWSDPADLSPNRAPVRCQPGTPAAKPLPQKTHIVVTAGQLSSEYMGPLRMAIAKGEFAKENLDVELKQVPSADAASLLAKGDIDVLYSQPEAGMVNAVKQGFDEKWVLGNFSSPANSKTGIWVKLKNGQTPDQVNLKGARVGTAVGKTSVIMYPIRKVLADHGAKIDDVQFQQLDAAATVTALKNGGVDAAWILDPLWKEFDGKPGYAFLGGQPLGEPLGGLLYGPNMLHKNRDAGAAFVRAMVRTVSTYFSGDYKADPAFVQELATVLGSNVDVLKAVPSEVTDWEIRQGTVDRTEQAYLEGKVIQDPALPEDKLVDRSFYQEAVGHTG